MTKYFINGKLIATTKSDNPHDILRELLIDAQLAGAKVEVVKA